jgi:hypothetical protein
MKKKSHAALAIALVTGGLAAKSAHAGLNSPPVQNGDFEIDQMANPTYGYGFVLTNWYRASGAEAWVATQYSSSPYSTTMTFPTGYEQSTSYAVLEGSGGVNGQIFQQIGTNDLNAPITVNFLEALNRVPSGHSVVVSLYSGGSPSVTSTSSYGAAYNTYNLSGATLLGSQTFLSPSTLHTFAAETATFFTGTTGNAGDPLWLSFNIDSPNGGPQIGLDDVSVN